MSAINYGISCWQTQLSRYACDQHFDAQPGESHDDMEERAGSAGWVMGHWDGQAHYACPNCANTLWDPLPLRGMANL